MGWLVGRGYIVLKGERVRDLGLEPEEEGQERPHPTQKHMFDLIAIPVVVPDSAPPAPPATPPSDRAFLTSSVDATTVLMASAQVSQST